MRRGEGTIVEGSRLILTTFATRNLIAKVISHGITAAETSDRAERAIGSIATSTVLTSLDQTSGITSQLSEARFRVVDIAIRKGGTV